MPNPRTAAPGDRRKHKRWERRAHARRAELLAAAVALFTERGFAATRRDDVAARAGVSKATVYVYFADKQRLFEAVVQETVVPNLDRARALIDDYDGTTPGLIRALIGLLESVLESPVSAVLKVVIADSGNFPALARVWAELVIQRGFALVCRVIERGIARGELRPVNPADVAPLVIAPVVLLAVWKHSFSAHAGMQLDRHAILAAHADVVLRGLAKEASS
jgi:AcrR family transcriptional regulator